MSARPIHVNRAIDVLSTYEGQEVARLAWWRYTCADCPLMIIGYPTAGEAADAGRAHHHREHGCCPQHTTTCGLQDW